MKNLKSNLPYIFAFIVLISCSVSEKKVEHDSIDIDSNNYDFNKETTIQCTKDSKPKNYKVGDTPCWEKSLRVSSQESLKIHFKIMNKSSYDLYERGYQELLRIKDKKIVEKIKLRRDDDAYWSEVPFVRIRKQKYLADLDGDGFLEFAIFPFSPGSAIWGTVRIFSLKEKIEYWGEGRYQFEGDTYVQLGCMKCSKFNPNACKSCY